jgi:PAS domain S-box-containing protein
MDELSHDQLKQKVRDLEKYRNIYAASPVGIGLARNRIIKWGNNALHDMLGYEPDALMDKNVRMIYPDEATYEQVGQVLYTGLKKKGIDQLETQWITRDGRIIDCHLQASTLDPRNPSKGVLFAAMDISKRKQTEKALRESEAQKMAILEASIDWIRHVDKDMKILWHNKIIAEALQLPAEKILGRPCYAVLHDRNTPCRGCPTVKAMKSGRIERAVMHRPGFYGADSEVYWEAYSVPLKDENGEIVSFIQISKDISDQVQAMEALRESREKYRQLFESESDAVMIFDGKTLRFEEANQATLDLYGYSREEFLALTVLDISNEKDKTRDTVQRIIGNDPASKRVSLRYFKKKDGSLFPGEVFSGTFKSGNQTKIIGAVRDITERLQAEEKIHALTQEQMKAQEKERLKISRYLHDQVAQDLSTLRIGCETLFDSQPDTPVAVRQKVNEMSGILQNTISAVRNLSYDLRPPGMDHLGLARTLMQYCEDFSKKYDLQIDYHSAGMEDLETDYETEINLFRVAQEALNNINLHAAASRVTIRLVASFPSIIMRIEDNGKGFDVEDRLIKAAGERRMGLGNLQERVRLLNGNLKIQSRPQAGTKILVEIPFKEKKSDLETKHTHH